MTIRTTGGPVNRLRPGLLLAGLLAGALVAGCTSSDDPKQRDSSPTGIPVGSNSQPAGAGTQLSSGPGAGSMGPTKNTYSAPVSAPYPTPGRSTGKVTDQTGVLDSLPGNAGRKCTAVGNQTQVRGGDIAMGDFGVAKRAYTQQVSKTEVPQLDFFLFPRHSRTMRSASVRIDPPSGKSTTVRTKRVEQADDYRYYAVVLPVRAEGSYRFTVTAGVDRGCFTVSFGS